MDIMRNRHQYLKSLKLEQYWDMKKSGTIGITEKVDVNGLAAKKISTDSSGDNERAIQKKLAKIKAKISAGARLTGAEKAFLRKHAPKLYLEYLKMERDQAAYKERLKRCRTRDDVERVKVEKLREIAAASKDQEVEETLGQLSRMYAAEKNVSSEIRRKPWQSEIDQKKAREARRKAERKKRVEEKKELEKRIREEIRRRERAQELHQEMEEEEEEDLEIWLEQERMLEQQIVEVVEEFPQEAEAPTTKAFAAYRAIAEAPTEAEKEKYSRKA